MNRPDPRELECLETIASWQSAMAPPCPPEVFEALLAKHLVERSFAARLPIEHIRPTYRLTPEGTHGLELRRRR
jgi:hypothetical protein